jgi:hypothetical protein
MKRSAACMVQTAFFMLNAGLRRPTIDALALCFTQSRLQ